MKSFELLACTAGVASGLVAGWLSSVGSKRLGDNRLWRQWAAVARSLLSPDSQSRVFQEYLRLWPALFVFTARQLAIAVIALSPVVLTFAGLVLLAEGFWDRQATCVEIAPPQQLVVELAGRSYRLDEDNRTIPAAAGLDRPALISIRGGRLRCATLMRKQAYASNWAPRLLLGSLGFEILKPERPLHAEPPFFLVRPSRGDANVLWPYLSDWEFDFFLVVCLASVAAVLALKLRIIPKPQERLPIGIDLHNRQSC